MFELNGKQVSFADLQNYATQNNIDFETYMNNMFEAGMVEAPEARYIDPIFTKKTKVEKAPISVEERGVLDDEVKAGYTPDYVIQAIKLHEFKNKVSKRSDKLGSTFMISDVDKKENLDKLDSYYKSIGVDIPAEELAEDIEYSPTKIFFDVLRKEAPGVGYTLTALATFTRDLTSLIDNMGDFVETMVEIKASSGRVPGSGIVPYMARRMVARETGITQEEFDEANPYNVLELKALTNILDKATIKYIDKETGQQEDFLSLFSKGEYSKSATSFVMETAGAAPSLLVSMLPGGYAMLGGGSFAEKLDKDLFERPDETAGAILSNALIYGGADAIGEFFGGRYMRGLFGLGNRGGKEALDRAKETIIGGVGAFIKSAWKGGRLEFMQESITSVVQDFADIGIYGDERSFAQVFRKALHSGLIGFALGSGTGTIATGMNKANKTKVYEYLAPKSYKKQQIELFGKLEKAQKDLKNAPPGKKEKFQRVVDKIKKQQADLKEQLYNRFEIMQKESPQDLELIIEKLYEKHEALDIINGGKNYSNEAKEQAKKDFKDAADVIGDLFAVTDINYDSEVELELSKFIRAAEEIDNVNKNLWFKAKDLQYEYVDTQEKFEELKKQYGDEIASEADGFFTTVEDGKKKIFINRDVAASASATNVIGHELLHYALSNRFANDPKFLRESVIAFNQYLDEINPYIKKAIEKRLANPKNGYALLDADGKVQRDSDGLIVMKEDSYIEEYFTMFSDLIKEEKIDVVEEASTGIKNKFRTMVRGLGLGFNNVDFKNGQEVFDLLIDYNKNIGRTGLLRAITQRKAIESVAGKRVEKADSKPDVVVDTKKEKPRYIDGQVPVKTEEFKRTTTDGDVIIYKATTHLDGRIQWTKKGKNDTIFVPTKVVDSSVMQRDNISPRQAMEVFEKAGDKVEVGKVGDYKTVMNPKMFDRLTPDQQQRVDPERAKKTKKSETIKKSMSAEQKTEVKKAVDKLGQVDIDGNDLTKKGEGNFYYQADIDNIIKELRKKRTDKKLGLENEAYLDNLIAAQYKVRPVPDAFVNDVFNQLLTDIKGFKPEENNSLFGYLGPRIKFRAGDVYKEVYEKKGPATVPTEEVTKEGEVKVQVKAEKDVAMKELETKDVGITAQIKEEKAKRKVKKETKKESEFRRKVGFETGSQIYNEILDAARKSLIRAYAKTKDIKDVAARERAVVAEIQKEHNSLNSPLFKQIKNWLTYGLAQEKVPKGTKDIYFDNLKEFVEDITKLISTSDLVQIERIISESDRIFTVYKETLTRKGDVEKAVNNLELPPDALRKYDRDTKVSVYEKVIPSPTQIIAFAAQPAKIPKKDKQGNDVMKDGAPIMIRSGLKGTRKDGIAKNIVNGLVLDAVMEARQSKEVQDRLKILGVSEKSVSELSVATGRQADIKFSKSAVDGNLNRFAQETLNNKKKVYLNFGQSKNDKQRRGAIILLNKIIQDIENDSLAVAIFTNMRDRIQEGHSAKEVVNDTYQKHVDGKFAGTEGNIYAKFFEGNLQKEHLINILGLVKKISAAQINNIAFNNAIKKLENQTSNEKILTFLRQYSKQIRTAGALKKGEDRFTYNGKNITTNRNVVDHIIKPILEKAGIKNRFGLTSVRKGERITFKNKKGEVEVLKTYQNSTETKQVFKKGEQAQIDEAVEINRRESKEAIDFMEGIIKSKDSIDEKIANARSQFADTDSPGRKMATFAGMVTNYKGETVLDHRPPINKVEERIIETIKNPTKENIANLRTFLENTKINNIPKNVDTKLVKLGFKTKGDMDVMNNPEIVELMEGVEIKNYGDIKLSRSTKSESFVKAIKLSRSAFDKFQAQKQRGKQFVKNLKTKQAFDKFQAQKQKGKEFVESIRPQLKKSRGITVLDFDDTLATTESLVRFTRPDGTTGALNAEQYASTYQDLLEMGYKFDFTEFDKVIKAKLAPLFQKALKLQDKFGPENMFILTARPPAARKAIRDFLKANGLNIPLKNITGLGNSTAESKALWIADKVAEGYNDFYFADDALQNVQAVKNMLDQFDVKSKVQQAKVKFSKSMDNDFNDILEEVTGIDAKKRFSEIKARKRGESKGKFRFFIPPSHEDFVGLLYNFMGKGRKGDQHRNFFEQALVRPLNRAYREIDTAKQAIANDYKSLNKRFPKVKKKLAKNIPGSDFTFQDAIRVYLWNKHGYDIPGLSKTDQKTLVDLVVADSELQGYAETLNTISKQDAYVDPGPSWETGNIRIDLIDATGRVGRAQYFAEFNENADIIFSPDNLNKIEAAYGKDFREALEDMLHAIKTGINRPKGASAKPNMFLNWLNASVSGVMFFNTRSSILQQMSIVNYINFADNNIIAAAKAFANQLQYWKDFAMIFNSDMLKQRRGGIGTDINGAELAEAVKKARPGNLFDQVAIIVGKALKLGFLPTQIGDNIAIATGGATFYRNRVNKYIKDGLSKKEAEEKAWIDFQDLTQSTQQSSRPDMTSQQQRSWIGKLILNFQNITSQYNRIIKKAALDIKNKRISPPYTTRTQSNLGNLSKILYYGGIQNIIFYSLQTALFAVMFDEDEDEDQIIKKKERVINGTIDSILRGTGIYGAVASTLKNMIIKFGEQREKGYNKDESAVLMEALNLSPVVGIRARGIVNAEKTLNYSMPVIKEMETFDLDNPMWSAVTNYIQVAGPPANRVYQKTINVRNALDTDYTNFQRLLFLSGYTTWSLGLGDNEAIIEAKEKAKINKKNTKKKKKKKKTKFKTKFKTF